MACGDRWALGEWAGPYVPVGLMVASRFHSSDIDLYRYRACGMLFTALGCRILIGWLALSGEVLQILGTPFGRAPQTIFEEAPKFNYLYLGMSLAFVGMFMGLATRTMSMPLVLALLMPVVLVFAAIGFRNRLAFALGGLTGCGLCTCVGEARPGFGCCPCSSSAC